MSVCSLVDLLSERSRQHGDKRVFSYIRGEGDGGTDQTYRGLHARAMAIAGELQAHCPRGANALLLYPPGLAFVEAFFGCLFAGVVAVPVAPPRGRRVVSSLKSIADAAKPAVVLTTTDQREQSRYLCAEVASLRDQQWIATDAIAAERADTWRDPAARGDDLAFLQFTSGSTAAPKGVMLSHANLLSNSTTICEAFGATDQSRAVFWLPLYHDMGLIGGVIQPVFCGGSCTLMAPAAFLQRPMLWLETISRDRATISGGPDFAYDLCVRKISEDDRRALDLSCWTLAFTGAETIRAQTLDRFSAAFSACGFDRKSFFPCYGLAESTLIVSGGPRQRDPAVVAVDANALRENRIAAVSTGQAGRRVVGCGPCLAPQRLEIVDPKTLRRCGAARVGEIWVQGPSVARGYFHLPQVTAHVFDARLADAKDGPFLRTGDLGFLHGGELHVTGRLKDLIVIRGRNYYPEDIEQTVEEAHPGFRAGHCLAFSVEVDDQERLVIVQEIEPRLRTIDSESAFQAIRQAVAAVHQLEVHAIVLAKAGANPKTSSGKRRRSAGRKSFLSGRIDAHAQWVANTEPSRGQSPCATEPPNGRPRTAPEIKEWLVRRIAMQLGVPAARVAASTPFLELGMGSLDAMEVAADLQNWLGRSLSPTAVYNYPNIDALAERLEKPDADPPPTSDGERTRQQDNELDADDLLREVRALTDAEMEAFILREMAKQAETP